MTGATRAIGATVGPLRQHPWARGIRPSPRDPVDVKGFAQTALCGKSWHGHFPSASCKLRCSYICGELRYPDAYFVTRNENSSITSARPKQRVQRGTHSPISRLAPRRCTYLTPVPRPETSG